MQTPSAYLLVFHGSRDPRPQTAINQLADLIQQKLQALYCPPRDALAEKPAFSNAVTLVTATPILVGTATLECASLPLHEQIQQFSQTAIARGIHRLQIVPLFLLPGVHVLEDIPEQVAIAQQHLTEIDLKISPYLGSSLNLKNLFADRNISSAEAGILLSHGSRRSQANRPVEALATQLGMVPAYWSVAPTLESRLQEFCQLKLRKIVIFPYFLFSGSITDAIARSVEQFSQQFPSLNLHLASPLEASDNLADLLLEVILQSQN